MLGAMILGGLVTAYGAVVAVRDRAAIGCLIIEFGLIALISVYIEMRESKF